MCARIGLSVSMVCRGGRIRNGILSVVGKEMICEEWFGGRSGVSEFDVCVCVKEIRKLSCECETLKLCGLRDGSTATFED